MLFIYRYLIRHSKILDFTSLGKDLASRILYGLLGTLIFIILWSLIGYLLFTRPGYEQFRGFLPLPTIKALYQLIFDPDFWFSVYASLRRVIVGISIAFFIGLPFGLLVGFYHKLELITYTPVQFLRMISPVSWMPVAALVFRSFESAIYFLIAMSTLWPIVLNTAYSVSRVNPQWINMARNQGAKNYQLLLRIIIPSSLPYILTSLRLALGVAWIVLVPAEFLGVSSGLGYIINDARDTMEYDRLMAIIIAIGIVGFILDGALQLIQKSLSWSWG
jgi:NitT/TauT family transport system permease protein